MPIKCVIALPGSLIVNFIIYYLLFRAYNFNIVLKTIYKIIKYYILKREKSRGKKGKIMEDTEP